VNAELGHEPHPSVEQAIYVNPCRVDKSFINWYITECRHDYEYAPGEPRSAWEGPRLVPYKWEYATAAVEPRQGLRYYRQRGENAVTRCRRMLGLLSPLVPSTRNLS
jgi:hypothetical protein